MSMEYVQKPKFHIIPSGDYLHVVCAECEEPCELDFKGRDPSMVKVEIICPNCGSTGDWKLWRAGEGFPYDTEFDPRERETRG